MKYSRRWFCSIFIGLLFVPLHADRVLSCEITGGLGNQLFQIAATLATAWENGYDPKFPQIASSPSMVAPRSTYWSTVFSRLNTASPHVFSDYQEYKEGIESAFSPITVASPHVKLVGYWQSEKYFLRYKNYILDIFRPSESINQYVQESFSLLTQNYKGPIVSVHLRRGDYLQISECMHLWDEKYKHYYIKAISHFPKNALFMVFSDEPSYAQEFFQQNFPNRQAVFAEEVDYIELYMMARCDHHILANSTFSWWGAYLNPNPQKIVIASKEWTIRGDEVFYRPDYFPAGWITISVLVP